MRFSKIVIENFRSFKEPTEIVFDTGRNLLALVGPNNSGKSNILSALALVLGVQYGPLGKRDLDPSDFYNHDTSNPVGISLHLSSPITAKDVYGQDLSIQGFRLEGKEYKVTGRKGIIHTDHFCFGKNAKGEEASILVSADRLRGAPRPLIARKYIGQIGNVYVLEPATLAGFFRTSGRGPLAELLDLYRDDFPNASNVFPRTAPPGTPQKQARDAFESAATEITEILRTEKLEEIEDALSENVSEYLGLPPGVRLQIDLGLPEYDSLLDELLNLRVREDPSLRPTAVAKLGTGYLGLFRMAVFQALTEINERESAIFIVEEPEAYLHPHLRRFFYKTLRELGQDGDQILYSTHSPEFVDLENYQEVARVTKGSEAMTRVRQVPTGTTISFDKLSLKVRGKGNQEIYFAATAFLVEGQDERVVFEALMEKRGIDYDAKSISIVDCGGKQNIPDYVDLCNALGIPLFAIFDGDHGNPASAAASGRIRGVAGNTRCHEFQDTLEAALKTTKQRDDNWKHLLGLIKPLDAAQITATYPELSAAVEAFMATLS